MTTHDRPGYHQADWAAADSLGARIRRIQYALITLGIAAYGFGAWVLMEWLFPL
jgi:hypothetical protein